MSGRSFFDTTILIHSVSSEERRAATAERLLAELRAYQPLTAFRHRLQSPRATQIIERRLTEQKPGFVSLVTILEVVWVSHHAEDWPDIKAGFKAWLKSTFRPLFFFFQPVQLCPV
jgi:predicted nucleic-acid-binding protein